MTLLWAGFLIGCVFGAAARLGRFCLLRGLRQSLGLDNDQRSGAPALQAFALALAVALIASQWLAFNKQVDLTTAQVVRSSFSWPTVLFGGLLFFVQRVLRGVVHGALRRFERPEASHPAATAG